jgi:hypothetical protein
MQRRGGQALLLFISKDVHDHSQRSCFPLSMEKRQVRCVEPGMAWSRSSLHELSAERQKAPHTALLLLSNHSVGIGDRQTLNPFRAPHAPRSQTNAGLRPPSTCCRFSVLRAVLHLQNRHFIYRYAQYIYDVYVYAIVNLCSVAYEQWGYADDRISRRRTDVPTSKFCLAHSSTMLSTHPWIPISFQPWIQLGLEKILYNATLFSGNIPQLIWIVDVVVKYVMRRHTLSTANH